MATAITVELADDAYATAEEAVRLGIASSQSSSIEEAIRLRTREVRHARMRVLAEQAMADPDFVSDMRDSMQAFQHTDKENWPVCDSWLANILR